jgi:hypothetical protein
MPHQVKRVSESTFLFFFTSYVSSTSVTQGGLSFFLSFVRSCSFLFKKKQVQQDNKKPILKQRHSLVWDTRKDTREKKGKQKSIEGRREKIRYLQKDKVNGEERGGVLKIVWNCYCHEVSAFWLSRSTPRNWICNQLNWMEQDCIFCLPATLNVKVMQQTRLDRQKAKFYLNGFFCNSVNT